MFLCYYVFSTAKLQIFSQTTNIKTKKETNIIIIQVVAWQKCKEKVQKKVLLKDNNLAQKPAQSARFVQESRFVILHKSRVLCRKRLKFTQT